MALYLLDSDAFIDWLNKIPGSLAIFQELARRGETLCLCSVVIAEGYAGLAADRAADADDIFDYM